MVGAIATAVGSVIGVVGKISVDIIKAKKEPDQADLELKDELEREKDKNNAAIERFTNVAKELTAAVEDLRTDFNKRMDDSDKKFVEVNQRIDEMDKRIEEYRNETREINKSELRHSIIQIYYQNLDDKKIDIRTKEDLCSLYAAYDSIGGNSFAHEVYEEMMNWEVE